MRGRHLSYRLRRRLVWLLVVAVVAGGITVAGLVLPSGQKPDHTISSPPSPADQAASREPPPLHLTRADRKAIRSTLALFISTSVARHHPERSWAVVGPALREGLTKRQWSTGNIPVVPYPAAGVDLLNIQSLAGGKALIEVVLEPTVQSNLARKTFQVDLQRSARAPQGWAVTGWVPEGVSQSQIDRDSPKTPIAAKPQHLATKWIFVPLGLLLAGIVLIPGSLFLREAYRSRRAEAEYRSSVADGDLRR